MRLTFSTYTHPQRGPQHSVLLDGFPVMATTDDRKAAERIFREQTYQNTKAEWWCWDGDTGTSRRIASFYDLRTPAVPHPVGTIN